MTKQTRETLIKLFTKQDIEQLSCLKLILELFPEEITKVIDIIDEEIYDQQNARKEISEGNLVGMDRSL
jgi:hypothetical protein